MDDMKVGENPKLEELVDRVVMLSKASDDKTLEAAKLLLQVRKMVDRPDIKWMEWAHEHIDLADSRIYELMRIAEAKQPAKELERLRVQANERQKRFRNHTKQREAEEAQKPQDPERAQLVAWAKKEPIERVKWVLNQIAMEFGNDNNVADQPRSEREVRDAA